jgi:hypothetical protein
MIRPSGPSVRILPEIGRVVGPMRVEVDHPGMGLGAVADEVARAGVRSTENPSPSSISALGAVDQPASRRGAPQLRVRQDRLARGESGSG